MVGYISDAVAAALKAWTPLTDANVMPVRASEGSGVIVNTTLPAIVVHVVGTDGDGNVFIGGGIRQFFDLELWFLADVPNYSFSADNSLQAAKLDLSDEVIRCVEHPDFLTTVKQEHDLNMQFDSMPTETTYGTKNAISVTVDVHKVIYKCSVQFDPQAEDYNRYAELIRIEVDNNGINDFVLPDGTPSPTTREVTLGSGDGGHCISNIEPFNEGTYNIEKGTLFTAVNVADDGNIADGFLVDGVHISGDIFNVEVTDATEIIGQFIIAALTQKLKTFISAPVDKGNWYFGDHSTFDNDVLCRNERCATFSGAEQVKSNLRHIGGTPVNLDLVFTPSVLAVDYLITCGATNTTRRGYSLRQNNSSFRLDISDGVGFMQTITIGRTLVDQINTYSIRWDGKLGSDITLNINSEVFTYVAEAEWVGDSHDVIRVSSSFIGLVVAAILENHFEYILNHGQGTTIYDISGNGNDGTVVGATAVQLPADPEPEPLDLETFWGSTADVEPFPMSIGATLYKNTTDNSIMPICADTRTLVGTDLLPNGIIEGDGRIITDGVEFSSDGSEGQEHHPLIRFDTLEVGKSYLIVGVPTAINGQTFISFHDGTKYLMLHDNPTSFRFSFTYASGAVIFSHSSQQDFAAEWAMELHELGALNEIEGFDNLGYFPPNSGALKGLPNTYTITGCEPAIPDGEYTADEIGEFVTSENIEIIQDAIAIQSLIVNT